MKSFFIKSLGCKQNQLEGQIIADNLIEHGLISVNDIKKADFYILNSCSVTSHTDSEVHYLLNQAKKINPLIKTILTGCVAQTISRHKDFNYNIADIIVGNTEKLELFNYLEREGFFVEDIMLKREFENKFLLNPTTTRVSVKIQDGCNNRCAYCIIPYARGNSRSNTIENIIKQIEIIASKGVKEIVLTGIHIGQWGLEWGKTLKDLLIEIEKTPIARYRLGSLYINEMDEDFISFLAKSKKFCPHFHLSLQSLCDKTLKNMNRKYTALDAMNIIKLIKEKFKNPFLGCDIIVGFPYETEEDFLITYNNLKKAGLSAIHCFPYSKRDNTPASSMPQVQDSIKTARAAKIAELNKELHQKFLEENKNENAEILIQKKNKSGYYSALTRNYIKVKFKSEEENLRHTLKTVNLAEYEIM